jgi:hypothetical protein
MANSPTKWTAFDVSTGTKVWESTNVALAPSSAVLYEVVVANSSAYLYGMVEGRFSGTSGVAFTAGDYVNTWFIKTLDGTLYEDSTMATAPARPADVVFPLPASSVANVQIGPVALPPCSFKVLVQNKASTNLSTVAASNRIQLYRMNAEIITA